MPKNLVPNQFDYSGIYVEGKRSQFRFNKPHLASFMSGMLVPMGDPIRVFPGTKLDLNINAVIRSNTMVVPPLDGIFIDIITVWIPDRIVWTHQPQFLGENDTTAWTQSNSYSYPSVELSTFNDDLYEILDEYAEDYSTSAANLFLAPHYGLYYHKLLSNYPAGSVSINTLAFRGYYAAWNHLFRDENYQRPVLFSKGDTGSFGEFGYFLRDYQFDSSNSVVGLICDTLGDGLPAAMASLMPVNKFHDAYTSLLPQPQFGNAVELSLATDDVPVMFKNTTSLDIPISTSLDTLTLLQKASKNGGLASISADGSTATITGSLVADLASGTAITVNQFRTAVMTQRYLEALGRGGRRAPEFYEAIYNVKNSSVRCDYPQVLTRSRYILGVNQVVATADSSGEGWTSHLGDTGAYSLTSIKNAPCCEQDFTEFGYVHIFYCIRSTNRYSQMIQEHFTRKVLLDEYNPYFDHIGDVNVPNYLVNTSAGSLGNFGFQEAWWPERTQLGLAVGAVNKAYGSLAYWTLGEVFDSSLTTCTPGYLTFDPAIFNDVFVSSYDAYPQFIGDFLIHGKKVARMSQHSLPGIVGRI